MQREIKFTAAYRNEIYEVTEIMWSNQTAFIWRPGVEDDDGEIVSLDDIRLMQFTGLRDKNGKEIYEGDSLDIENEICEVKYNPPSFAAYNSKGHEYNIQYSGGEVFGNLWENPELLK